MHGTLIAYQGVGCLLVGASGTGKSQLAIEAMTLGAVLIADDQVQLSMDTGMLFGAAVPHLKGVMEMRGAGLLKWPNTPGKQVIHMVIELSTAESERAPAHVTETLLGQTLPRLTLPAVPKTNGLLLVAAIKAVQEGRRLPPDWHPTA
jgi:HPr kinase/phosphorylase